jgi:hypothetical protein
MNMRRIDEPGHFVGSIVRWQTGQYRVERVEQQAAGWMAVIVKPSDFGAHDARAWFVPCSQLERDR